MTMHPLVPSLVLSAALLPASLLEAQQAGAKFEEHGLDQLLGWLEAGERPADPQDEHHPQIQCETHPDDLVRAMTAVELRYEVGAQKG